MLDPDPLMPSFPHHNHQIQHKLMWVSILIWIMLQKNIISLVLYKTAHCMHFHPIRFLLNVSVRLWDDICTVSPKSNQVLGSTVPVLFGCIQNGWTSVIAVICASELELPVCDVLSCALCDIWLPCSSLINGQQVKRKPTNAFLTVTYDDVSLPCCQPATSLGIFIASHEELKQISNPSLKNSNYSSSKDKWRHLACTTQFSKTSCSHRLKLFACLRKYNGPKLSVMIVFRDRLKLLERHQKASDCYISDLWSNTSWEQMLPSAHISVWLLHYSREGTFLSRVWRYWKRIGILVPWSEASETSEWREKMLILPYMVCGAYQCRLYHSVQ